jgi:hypothetical protein
MPFQFAEDNLDVAGYLDIGICETPEISPDLSSLSTPLATKIPELFSRSPTRYVPEVSKFETIFKFKTSSVANRDYPIRFPLIPKYEISREAEDFISRQKKAVQYREDITTISDKAREFLKRKNIEPRISISLFKDPEYSDWVETKIIVQVQKNDFKQVYKLYNKLLSYSLKGARKKTLEKAVIVLEHL